MGDGAAGCSLRTSTRRSSPTSWRSECSNVSVFSARSFCLVFQNIYSFLLCLNKLNKRGGGGGWGGGQQDVV